MADHKDTFSDNYYEDQFAEKYYELLLGMSECEENFQVRKAYIDENVGWDRFTADIYKAACPKEVQRLTSGEILYGEEGAKGMAFAEALCETIKTFHQTEDKHGILHYLRFVCKRKHRTAQGAERYDDQFAGAGVANLSPDKKLVLLKLIKAIDKMKEEDDIPYEKSREVLKGLLKEIDKKATIKDLDNAYSLVKYFRLMPSLDKHRDDGEGDAGSIGEFAQFGARSDQYKKHLEADYYNSLSEENTDVVELLIQKSIEVWDALKAASSKLRLTYTQAFLTQSVLTAMKCTPEYLDARSAGKSKPPVKFYTELPAGNEMVYAVLKPHEKDLYGKIFYEEYLSYVFDNYPALLENVYAWFLKEGIKLIDREIAAVFGVGAGTISKNREKYEETYLSMLEKAMNWKNLV